MGHFQLKNFSEGAWFGTTGVVQGVVHPCPSWDHLWSLFSRSLQKWRKCKNEQHYSTLGGFLGVGASSGGSWRLSWERFGGYVGRCWLQDGVFLAILSDVWTSWRQGWRTRAQDAADDRKRRIFGGLEGGRDRRNSRGVSRVPPLKKLQRKGLESPPPPGAPNSTWKLVELRLWMELSMDRDTQPVPKGTWRI